MDKTRDLYHEEVENLDRFKKQIDTHAIFREDLITFSNNYEELVSQAKVITRISDRLQKKLNNANVQIKEQNEEIKIKHDQLKETIDQLAAAKIGRRASAIMLFVALILFITEQVFLQDIIADYVAQFLPQKYVFLGSLFVLLVLFIFVKFFESGLEGYFMNKEKKKILSQEAIIESTVKKGTSNRPSLITG